MVRLHPVQVSEALLPACQSSPPHVVHRLKPEKSPPPSPHPIHTLAHIPHEQVALVIASAPEKLFWYAVVGW